MASKNHNPITHTYYYLRINRFLWTRFKSACAKRGEPMRVIIVKLIKAWTEKNEL